MLNEATRQFVRLHGDDDVRRLALQAHATPDVDLPMALDQIRGRQTARQKLPSWAATEGIVYPPHLSMEQCSSEQTAQYKAQLLARLLQSEFSMKSAFFADSPAASHDDCCFLDLTGGFGVDFVAMAKALSEFSAQTNDFRQNRFVYVEQNARLCDLARHNFPLLGLPNVEIVCETAENFLSSPNTLFRGMGGLRPSPTFIFLDPARRDAHGQRTYALEDCTPNVLEIRDQLFKIADLPTASHGDRWLIVLKLSPMLDWHRAVEELKTVSEVHIVSVANECKELLLVVQKKAQKTRIFCVNDHQSFSYEVENNEKTVPCIAETAFLSEKNLLFIPNSSVMKAGSFAELCDRFRLASLAPNSHLFVKIDESSAAKIDDFPGKIFQISAISSMNKRDLRDKFKDIDRANIATRNFPMKPEELRRRLKLREGGDNFIFATTLADGKH
ncbi:MAG: hypothetical protein IKT22_08460, partial [Prevotella sp.]|nr:hypothetical protein [Prevotella sp.]